MILQLVSFGFGMALLDPTVQESLGLSDAQRKEVQELVLSHQSKMVDLRAQLQKKRLALRLALQEGDESRANSLAKEIGSLQSKMLQERVRFKLALRKALGDEKFAKFMRMRPPRGHRHGKGRGHRGPHPGGPPGPPPGM